MQRTERGAQPRRVARRGVGRQREQGCAPVGWSAPPAGAADAFRRRRGPAACGWRRWRHGQLVGLERLDEAVLQHRALGLAAARSVGRVALRGRRRQRRRRVEQRHEVREVELPLEEVGVLDGAAQPAVLGEALEPRLEQRRRLLPVALLRGPRVGHRRPDDRVAACEVPETRADERHVIVRGRQLRHHLLGHGSGLRARGSGLRAQG